MTVRPRPPLPARQQGIAVITAMLVVTIATVLAVELAWETNLDIRRTEGLLTWDQAHQYGYGAEAFAVKTLEEVLQDQTGSTSVYSRDKDGELCQGFAVTLDGQGGMTGGVCDLQARFNLNNLLVGGKRDKLAAEQFRRLLDAVSAVNEEIDIEPDVADVIVESTIDWIDPDTTAEFNGAEDDTYTSEQPPYRAANFWFTNVSELRAVRGVTPEIFSAILPYVAALPVSGQRTLINVNTASVPVLMSLGESIDIANAEDWVSQSTDPFEDATPFAGFIDPAMIPYLGFSSSYFELKGFVSIGTTRLGMYSLLESTGPAVVARVRRFDVVDVLPSAPEAETVSSDEVTETDE